MVDIDNLEKKAQRIWPKLTTEEKSVLLSLQGRATRHGFPVGSSLDPRENGAEDVTRVLADYEERVKNRK